MDDSENPNKNHLDQELERGNQPTPDQNLQATTITSPQKQGLYKFASIAILSMFAMPVLGAIVGSFTGDHETRGLAGFILILMGVYSVPFIAIAFIFLELGKSFQGKGKQRASNVLYSLAIAISIIDIVVMLGWIIMGSSS